jgi:hypothetical protein
MRLLLLRLHPDIDSKPMIQKGFHTADKGILSNPCHSDRPAEGLPLDGGELSCYVWRLSRLSLLVYVSSVYCVRYYPRAPV